MFSLMKLGYFWLYASPLTSR